ncbi:chemotaxis protein CheA [Haloterrigena alkaliphila]|uniref:Chemotaxis protein CheA n=1 Tax=Haloterrigena alkaliphila TaxID=2816475 RepID=A0A8A2VCG9_9EURY|nr:chemotaxis protein CheA [Haloterrigena alkaliphila]QSW98102.1 Hpt domain-containing protein [Haloterrigena alkaliphila]
MTDYVTDFVQESEERITELNNALLTLERDPTDDEALEQIFRVAHTLKGNCGAMGLDPASDLAHAIEDVLDAVRTGDLEVTADLMDVIFDAVDELETMIDEVAADGEIDTDPSATIEALRDQLEAGTDQKTIRTPTTDEIDAVIERFEPPADDEHHAYLVRLGVVDRDDVNNGNLVLDALIDAFDLIGTEPPRDEIEAGDAGGQFDAVFGSAVGEAAIASGLEPVEEVADFELVDVSDRFEARADAAAAEAESASGPGAGISSEDAADLEVDDLLDEFEEFDNLDEMVEDVEDDELEAFENMGEAGSFDDLLDEEELALDAEPDVATEDTLDEGGDLEADETDAASATEPADDEDVDDANAVFNELKDEVEMVGFDELQAELDELEFDEFDNDDEVGMDELLGDDVDVEDDSFLEGEPSEDAVDDILYDGDDESTESTEAEAAVPGIDEKSMPDEPSVADLVDGTAIDDDGPVAVGPADEDDLAVADDSGESTADADDAPTAEAADELEATPVDDGSDAVGSDDESDPVAVAEEPDESVSAVESDDSAEASVADDSVVDDSVAEPAAADSSEEAVADDTLEEPVVDDSPEESVADDSSEESDWDESDESVDGTDEDDTAESFEAEFEDEFASSPADEATEAAADDDPFADDSLADDSLADDDPFADDEFADDIAFGGTDESFDAESADDLEDDAFDDAFADDEFDDPFADDDFADEFDESDAGSTDPVDSDAGSFGDDRADDGDDADDGVVRRIDEPTLESPSLSIPETTDRPDADQQTDEIQSVRVDVDQIDSLLTLVEGLVTSRVRLRHAATEGEETGALETELDDLEDLTTELQETVMDIRLVPLQTVTNRLPRVVRDIAREQDKEVAFEMTGEDVELDRSILDRIGDPLIHLVRNAVDHGIEPPAERGDDKPSEGTVEVHADRARDRVTITVEDDGSGLDPDRLRAEAVDADILTEAEADDLSDDEAYELIFHPGLSTADEVTDVSGRGVGMDVVKRTVEDLEGTVSIDSEIGAGTTVTMTLPVTVAIDDVLFVESGGEEFGVPTKAVQDIEPAEVLETVEGRPALPDAEDYSVVRLDETLETPRRGVNGDGMIVRIRGDVRPVALHCDHVHGQQEVVVKPFEGFMSDIPGLSGATVRGRGEVVNILDVTTL